MTGQQVCDAEDAESAITISTLPAARMEQEGCFSVRRHPFSLRFTPGL
jgi:hypothetical protein